MANITIRDVPAALHEDLKRRAAERGQSLQQYLLRRLAAIDEQAAIDEWVEQVEDHVRGTGTVIGATWAADAVRADRESR